VIALYKILTLAVIALSAAYALQLVLWPSHVRARVTAAVAPEDRRMAAAMARRFAAMPLVALRLLGLLGLVGDTLIALSVVFLID
jgi:hypothetical protein